MKTNLRASKIWGLICDLSHQNQVFAMLFILTEVVIVEDNVSDQLVATCPNFSQTGL